MRRWRRAWGTGRGRTEAEEGRGGGSGASGQAPWTGLAAPSGKPARAVKAAGATKKLLDPPSQTRASRAQCAPRQGAVGASRQDLAEEDEKTLHKELTFSETALICSSPLTGRLPGRNIEGPPAQAPTGVDETKNPHNMAGSLPTQAGS